MALGSIGGLSTNAAGLYRPTSIVGNQKDGDAFTEALVRAGAEVVKPQDAAQAAVDHFSENFDGHIHETMITLEKADVSMKFMMNVRNKLLDAYREVMRMGQ